MNMQRLIDTAATLVAGDRGLLAMDESTGTFDQRFAANAIAWRGAAATTPTPTPSLPRRPANEH